MEELKKSSSCGEMELRRMRYLQHVFRDFDYASPQEVVQDSPSFGSFFSKTTSKNTSSESE